MNKIHTLILGSGIGGLSAGAALKENGVEEFLIVDKLQSLPFNLHNGLHYLHSNDFGTPFPFSFKKMIMTEEIWNVRKDTFSKSATLPEAFEYSRKIMENLRHPSSILDPGKFTNEVFLPESNNMNELLIEYEKFIGKEKFKWNMLLGKIDAEKKIAYFIGEEPIEYENIISTIPIQMMHDACGIESNYTFKNKELYITNYTTTNIVPNWLIVLYIADAKFPPYRITVMNNILSMESMDEMSRDDELIVKYHIAELFDYDLSSKTNYKWEQGRIFGVTKEERKSIADNLISKSIYQIGRFGLWDGKLRMDTTIKQAKMVAGDIKSKTNSQYYLFN